MKGKILWITASVIVSVVATIIAVSILVGGIQTMYLNSNCYYSKKLVSAIDEDNINEVRQILEKKPTCINTFPSIIPRRLRELMDMNRVFYPMNAACANANIEIIKLMIENGADVNCYDGFTPLSNVYIIKPDNWYQISQLLIENGASLDYITEESGGKSAILQNIVFVGYSSYIPGHQPAKEEEVMQAFHYALENCDHSNVDWMRVLQHSVSNDRMEIVKLLLDQKYCDVNDTTGGGMTALMFAARDSTPEMVQLLLDYGADKSTLCEDGKTAYDYAAKSKNKEIMTLLEN